MKKKKRIFNIISSIFLMAIIVILAITYKNSNSEENIYLNSGNNEMEDNQENIDGNTTKNESDRLSSTVEEVKSIEIMSLGNIIIHQSQIDGAKNESGYDFSPSFQYVKDMISEADISMGILEGTLAGGEPTGYPCFNSPDTIVDSLKDAGLDIVNYANNHIYDYDDEGLLRTVEVTEEKGLDALGIKNSTEEKNYLIKEVEGVKIGFISYVFETAMSGYNISINSNVVSTYGQSLINTFNYSDLDSFYNKIQSEIASMREEGVQFIITSMHWGEEYNTYIEDTQKNIANKLNELGVDIVLGGHPHVIQPYETIVGENGHATFVLYSQGNALSNQSEQEIGVAESEDGIMAKFTLEVNNGSVALKEYEIIPTWVYKEAKDDGTYHHKIIPVKEALTNPEAYNINDEIYGKLQSSLTRTENIIGIR